MSSGKSNTTQTTVSQPPAYLTPFLHSAAQRADQLYRQGGTPITPFSPESEQAMTMATNRATAGSPVMNQANTYAQNVLGGQYLGANPWLDQVYNRAAGNVVNTVQSNFAGAGRNLGQDAAGVATGRLNDLATSIYGGDYDAERQRMQAITSMAPSLAQNDYTDISQLANVGAQREALAREQAGQPAATLDEYIARLQGFSGGTVTQQNPTERNRLAGAAGGAMAGSMFGPWGMLGGAVLGGLYG